MCITDHCNDAEVTTAMLQISVPRYLKRFIMASRILPYSQLSGKIYNSVVSNKFMV
jgi:hypothetical protein